MKRQLARINFLLRRVACRLFGHVKADVSLRSVGMLMCRRCLRITDMKTVRRTVTDGDIEQRMKDHPPEGYSFASRNCKSPRAKFVSPTGKLVFVTF